MKTYRWAFGLAVFLFLGYVLAALPVTIMYKWFYALLLACFLGIFRLFRGPTVADRAAAIKVISVLIISFCGVLSLTFKWDVYMDIALAWAIQAFVGTIAFAKYLEGRSFDD